jgi:hypothetical protein
MPPGPQLPHLGFSSCWAKGCGMAEHPPLPDDKLRAALGSGHPEHGTIDRLHAELGAESPDRGSIEAHVHRLRSLPEIAAIVANWWDDPSTQRFISNLSATGI